MIDWDEVDWAGVAGEAVLVAATHDCSGYPDYGRLADLYNWLFAESDGGIDPASPVEEFLRMVWAGGCRSADITVATAMGRPNPTRDVDNCFVGYAVEFMLENPDDDDVKAVRAAFARVAMKGGWRNR